MFIMKLDKLLSEIKKEIRPSKAEKKGMESIINEIIHITKKLTSRLGLEYTISGSYIRDTWLVDKKEFDLFILFPTEYSKGELQKLGLKLGEDIMKKLGGSHEVAYAEHPYTKGLYNGFSIDIVPCYKVKKTSEIKSAVDRTPFHNEYMKRNIKGNLSDEVRLLKKFTKSIGVYGSDIKTMGFSGYLCEILIINAGSFKNLVKETKKWDIPHLIDIENHSAVKDYKTKYKDQPLIVIDPTDPKRNVAAALSPPNFIYFMKCCEEFIKKPSRDTFLNENRRLTSQKILNEINKRKTRFIGIRFKRPDTVDDILWSQLRRTSRRLNSISKENDFSLISSFAFADVKIILLVFEFEVWKLPHIKKITGPPIFSKKNSLQFKEKYKKTGRVYVESNKWVAETARKHKTIVDLLKSVLSKGTTKLLEMGIASKIAEVSDTYSIILQKDIENMIKKNRKLRKVFFDALERKMA